MISSAQFFRIFGTEFGVDPADLSETQTLLQDLEFDSFDMLRLMILAESLRPGMTLPEDVDFESVTLGQVIQFVNER